VDEAVRCPAWVFKVTNVREMLAAGLTTTNKGMGAPPGCFLVQSADPSRPP
jgi:hypothetical protein